METLFTEVYEQMPPHVAEQMEAVRDQIRRTGAIEDGGGKFPL